jgi:hypothetical protein
MGGSPGLQTNSTQLIVRMIHPAFCGMGGDALTKEANMFGIRVGSMSKGYEI